MIRRDERPELLRKLVREHSSFELLLNFKKILKEMHRKLDEEIKKLKDSDTMIPITVEYSDQHDDEEPSLSYLEMRGDLKDWLFEKDISFRESQHEVKIDLGEELGTYAVSINVIEFRNPEDIVQFKLEWH